MIKLKNDIKFGKLLLQFSAESFILPSAIQKTKNYNI